MRAEEPRFWFAGVDPAPALGKRSDDGSIVAGMAWPKRALRAQEESGMDDWSNPSNWWFGYRHAVVLRGASIDDWSGEVHHLHRRLGFSGVVMDPGGGGSYLLSKLNKSEQVIRGVAQRVRAIACPEDRSVGEADFVLHLWKRGDVGVEMVWAGLRGDDVLKDGLLVAYQEAVEHAGVVWPQGYYDRAPADRPEQGTEAYWSLINLDAQRTQLGHIQVLQRDDGMWQVTRNGARQYVTTSGRDDLAYAGMYAYAAFLIWLRSGGGALEETGGGLVCEAA